MGAILFHGFQGLGKRRYLSGMFFMQIEEEILSHPEASDSEFVQFPDCWPGSARVRRS